MGLSRQPGLSGWNSGLSMVGRRAQHEQGAVGATMVQIVRNKIALVPVSALARGILCNVLVCLAVGCAWERGV